MKKTVVIVALNGEQVKVDKYFCDLCEGILHARGKGNIDVSKEILDIFINIFN